MILLFVNLKSQGFWGYFVCEHRTSPIGEAFAELFSKSDKKSNGKLSFISQNRLAAFLWDQRRKEKLSKETPWRAHAAQALLRAGRPLLPKSGGKG